MIVQSWENLLDRNETFVEISSCPQVFFVDLPLCKSGKAKSEIRFLIECEGHHDLRDRAASAHACAKTRNFE